MGEHISQGPAPNTENEIPTWGNSQHSQACKRSWDPRRWGRGGIGDDALPAQKHQQVAPNKAQGASGEIDS